MFILSWVAAAQTSLNRPSDCALACLQVFLFDLCFRLFLVHDKYLTQKTIFSAVNMWCE